ncbi:uncharacterized protein LOC144146482 [Haemaphysalis longicornis]
MLSGEGKIVITKKKRKEILVTKNESQTSVVPLTKAPSVQQTRLDNTTIESFENRTTETEINNRKNISQETHKTVLVPQNTSIITNRENNITTPITEPAIHHKEILVTKNESQTSVVPLTKAPSVQQTRLDNTTIESFENKTTETELNNHKNVSQETTKTVLLPQNTSIIRNLENKTTTPITEPAIHHEEIIITKNESQTPVVPLTKAPPVQQTRVDNTTIESFENKTTETELNNHKNISQETHKTVVVPQNTSIITNLENNITTPITETAIHHDEIIITKNESQTSVVPLIKAPSVHQTRVDNTTIESFENKTTETELNNHKHISQETHKTVLVPQNTSIITNRENNITTPITEPAIHHEEIIITKNESQTSLVPLTKAPPVQQTRVYNTTIESFENKTTEIELNNHKHISQETHKTVLVPQNTSITRNLENNITTPITETAIHHEEIIITKNESQTPMVPLTKAPPVQQTRVVNTTIESFENKTIETELNNHKNISQETHKTVLVPQNTSITTNLENNITSPITETAIHHEEIIITKNESQTPVVPLTKAPPVQQTRVDNTTIESFENKTTETELNNHKNISQEAHKTVPVPQNTSIITNRENNITTPIIEPLRIPSVVNERQRRSVSVERPIPSVQNERPPPVVSVELRIHRIESKTRLQNVSGERWTPRYENERRPPSVVVGRPPQRPSANDSGLRRHVSNDNGNNNGIGNNDTNGAGAGGFDGFVVNNAPAGAADNNAFGTVVAHVIDVHTYTCLHVHVYTTCVHHMFTNM